MEYKTLLLTPYYFPIKVLRWEDAVKMRYEGTADVVAEYEDEVRSPSVTWKIPAVIRLRRMPRGRSRGVKFSRVNVYQRDGYRCQYCPPQVGRRPASELTFDHVVLRSAGGRTCWENITTACRACGTRPRVWASTARLSALGGHGSWRATRLEPARGAPASVVRLGCPPPRKANPQGASPVATRCAA